MSKDPHTKETTPSKEPTATTKVPVFEVMAQRKSCAADGVGLSHYILMDRKPR